MEQHDKLVDAAGTATKWCASYGDKHWSFGNDCYEWDIVVKLDAPAGCTLFLPATGYCAGEAVSSDYAQNNDDFEGHYWSSTNYYYDVRDTKGVHHKQNMMIRI